MGVTFIVGEEDYLSKYALDRLTGNDAEVRKTGSITADDVAWLNGLSFSLGERVLVLEMEELGADDELLKLLTSGELSDGFVIKCRKAKQNTKLFKWLSENAEVKSCDPLSDKLFDKFLRRKNDKVDMKISEETLAYLKEKLDYRSGRVTLWEIDTMMQMFSLFDVVTKEDVDTYVHVSAEQKAFDIVDRLAARDIPAAVRAAGAYDDSCIQAISAVMWSFKLALLLKTFSEKEVSVTPYQVRGVRSFLSCPVSSLEKIFGILNDSLKKMKTGMPEKACFVSAIGLVGDELMGGK